MGYIGDEVRATGIPCSVLTAEEANQFLQRVQGCFSVRRWPLWEYIENDVYVNDPEAWLWMKEFLGDEPAFFFFNPEDDKEIFRFQHAKAVVDVLEDCFGFEFYISDENLSYLLCFNHHDMLIAAGTAKQWLEARTANRKPKEES